MSYFIKCVGGNRVIPCGRTDRQTDRQTDGRTNRIDEANNRFSQFCECAQSRFCVCNKKIVVLTELSFAMFRSCTVHTVIVVTDCYIISLPYSYIFRLFVSFLNGVLPLSSTSFTLSFFLSPFINSSSLWRTLSIDPSTTRPVWPFQVLQSPLLQKI